jgi:hypothetical protein
LIVIFVLFPLVIWTGLAMSPAFNSAFPLAVNSLGGRQSARTLHFFVSGFLLLFVIIHIAMVILAGFTSRVRAMLTGATNERTEATRIATAEMSCHPERSEGPMQFSGSGKVHRFFASLRMTVPLRYRQHTREVPESQERI